MGKNHVSLLIGNGFNHFANNYINDKNNRNSIIDQLQQVNRYSISKPMSDDKTIINETINGISKALDEYCHLLDDIAIEESSHSGEYFLEKLFNFTKTFGVGKINDIVEDAIKKRIKYEITDRNYLRDSDGNSILVNVTLRSLFSVRQDYFSNAIYETLNSLSDGSIDVITTNYDYICESVFCEIKSNRNPELRAHPNISYMQLHGNYNNSIICTAPLEKINRIESQKFEKFKDIVSSSNTIILFGLGLWSDPHILSVLNRKKDCNIIIIDSDIGQYMKANYPSHTNSEDIPDFMFLKNNLTYFIDTTKPTLNHQHVTRPNNTPTLVIEALDNIVNSIVA